MTDGSCVGAGSTLPEPLVLLLLVGSGDGGAAVVAGADHGQDVDVLEEGDLGSGGDELEGETASTHWGSHVPPSDLKRLVHCSGRMVSTRRESFVCEDKINRFVDSNNYINFFCTSGKIRYIAFSELFQFFIILISIITAKIHITPFQRF